MMKVCVKCGVSLGDVNGNIKYCNPCRKEAVKEWSKASNKKYYRSDKGKATLKKYYEDNRDKFLKKSREYNLNNKDMISEKRREYYQRPEVKKKNNTYHQDYNKRLKDEMMLFKKECPKLYKEMVEVAWVELMRKFNSGEQL